MNKQRWLIIVFLALSAIVAVGLRAWLHPPLHLQAAQLLPAAKSMEGYGLTVDDKKIYFNQLKGRWTLLYFGYTSCADVCPLELQKLGQMLKQFDSAPVERRPLVVFISVDPERDNPALLKKYVTYFHSDMVAATGTNNELAALANALGAAYNRTATFGGKEYLIEAGADMPPGVGEHYLVNHSSRIFILDNESRYVGSFAPPHDAGILFADMQQLLKSGNALSL